MVKDGISPPDLAFDTSYISESFPGSGSPSPSQAEVSPLTPSYALAFGSPSFIVRPDVADDSGSSECMIRAYNWLNTCMHSHPNCSSPRLDLANTVQLPKRIIDVGCEDVLPRLCEVGSLSATEISYVALSHCWGSIQPYTTETTSIDDRMKSMPWDDIPKTFQDAIITTRSLKLR
jgi:hypothetical protein